MRERRCLTKELLLVDACAPLAPSNDACPPLASLHLFLFPVHFSSPSHSLFAFVMALRVVVLVTMAVSACALDNGLGRLPQMGYNTCEAVENGHGKKE